MKEEQKQILSEMMQEDEKLGLYDDTIEQAAQEYSKYLDDFSYQDFQAGALWQQKQMYSEEDMLNFAWFFLKNIGQYSDDKLAHFQGEYLKQFKKKL